MMRLIMNGLALVIVAKCLSGCEAFEPVKNNQELRTKIFMECLDKIPEGPRQTHYNDWSEVVDSCDSAAYRHSIGR